MAVSQDGPVVSVGGGGGGGGGGGAATQWVQITQAHLDAGTAIAGPSSTAKSIAVVSGRVVATFNAVALTRDGIRETSGIAVPVTTLFPDIDFDAHDLVVWLDAPASSNITTALAVALCLNPGATADGVGVIVTSTIMRAQNITATASLASGSAGSARARFTFGNPAAATPEIAVEVMRVNVSGALLQAAAADVVDLSDADDIYLYLQAASYSGAQVEDATASAGVYVALIPKIPQPS